MERTDTTTFSAVRGGTDSDGETSVQFVTTPRMKPREQHAGHKATNRTLATIALILAIILMCATLAGLWKLKSAVDNLRDDSSVGVQDGGTYELNGHTYHNGCTPAGVTGAETCD